jgi:5-methylcytosine-specific restriction endonuclease McrA
MTNSEKALRYIVTRIELSGPGELRWIDTKEPPKYRIGNTNHLVMTVSVPGTGISTPVMLRRIVAFLCFGEKLFAPNTSVESKNGYKEDIHPDNLILVQAKNRPWDKSPKVQGYRGKGVKTRAEIAQRKNEYTKKRCREFRVWAIESKGGCCVLCGNARIAELDFDHIDPSTKLFGIAQALSHSQVEWEAELEKCQLLCVECHSRKTAMEQGLLVAQDTHGTLSSYKNCHCTLCKAAHAAYMNDRYQRLHKAPEKPAYEHGTNRMYVTKKCRCEQCRYAHTQAERERRETREGINFNYMI